MTRPTNPQVQWQLDTAAVDDILQNLSNFRAGMQPSIAAEYKLGQKCLAKPDPRWYGEPDMMTGHTLLHIRDDRYGWLHYQRRSPTSPSRRANPRTRDFKQQQRTCWGGATPLRGRQ